MGLALAVAALLQCGAAHAQDAPLLGLDRIQLLLDQWREPEAAVALARLEARGISGGARYLAVKGELLFLKGDYAGALKALGEAERLRPGDPRVAFIRKRAAAAQELTRGHVRHRSAGGHFEVLTPPGKDQLLAHFAAETLEAQRQALKDDLGYAPEDTIRVEVYPTAEALARVSALTVADIGRTGTIALCKFNRLMIVTPRSLLRGYGWRDTLAHEYGHLVVSRASHNTVPIWLHEGLAKYLEARWRSSAGESPPLAPAQEHLLAEALRKGKLIPWAKMHPSMAKLPSQRAATIAFGQVQIAVDFLVRKVGTAGLRKALAHMRQDGKDAWQALGSVTGMTRRQFTAAWRRHLRGLKLRTLPGFVPPTLKLGKAPSREQRLASMRHDRARDLLRLADLLRSRRRTRAAIVEYEKARKLLGPREEFVANHLARAYLEIASPAQAIAALLPVLEYYPELPGPQVTIGMAYLKKGGEAEAAARHLKVGLRINPFDPEIHCGLARALAENDSKAAALHAKICKQLGGR